MNRRQVVAGIAGAVAGAGRATSRPSLRAQERQPAQTFGYPIGWPDRPPGVGFFIRHGYAVENTWFAPGNLHAGEDWYAVDGNTAGAAVLAIAAGEVVFAGFDYPGEVVIVQHEPELFSMYGHLDFTLSVTVGQAVERGETLGTVLARGDDVPNHLHVEMRTFLTAPEVNGVAPRYSFLCGFQCPPGPGYWPIAAPEHPSAMGWRNPTHIINQRAFDNGTASPPGEVVVASQPPAPDVPLWSAPPESPAARRLGTLPLQPGDRWPLREVLAGQPASDGTSAEAYQVWYRLSLPDGDDGWVQAAVPSSFETGGDGRPSTVRLLVYPLLPPP